MTQQIKFDIGELIRAADRAGIESSAIPSDANPWTWKDPRAHSWQLAFRSLNPAVAEEAEVSFGPPLSLALQAALEGVQPMTNDLDYELSLKRPHQHAQQREQQIKDALERMEQNLEDERTANANRNSPELMAMRKSESRQAAIHTQFAQYGTEILD